MIDEGRDSDPEPHSGEDAFRLLPVYSSLRHEEQSRVLAPVVSTTAAYGALIARVVWVLGDIAPTGIQDRVLRDLTADVFDFLLAWERAVLECQLGVGYPLARRAYESLSLMAVCAQDVGFAEHWDRGAKVGNKEVRAALARMPFREAEDELRTLYAFFSKGAHPNRDLIPERYLGAGNGFVLGSIGRPSSILTVDHCLNLIRMWAWFAPACGYYYRERLDAVDPTWGHDYLETARRAEEVATQLIGEYNRLLEHPEQD